MMAFKILFMVALVAFTQAAHPTEYIISAPSADHESVGSVQEHTIKGHYGQNAHSEYSSTANTAHSTSHVSRTSISNDVVGYGGHVAAPAYAHAAYAAPSIAHVAAPVAHVAHVSAPAYSHGYVAPAAVKVAAPAVAYAAAHTYAAPAYAAHGYTAPAYAAHGYAAPAYAAHGYAAPAISYGHGGALYGGHGLAYGGYGHGFGYKAAYASPHYAAPYAVKTAVAAAPVVHTSFLGHGAHYAY